VLTNNGGSKKTASSTTVASTPTTVAAAVKYPAGCNGTKPARGSTKTYTSPPPMTIDPAKTYVAHVATSCGTFDITLDAKDAPKTVNSFVFLANQKFYDGLTFHRLVPDFVIQGGDPAGNGQGGPGYKLPDEPPKNGYAKGSVAMANAGPGTTGSQFFVTVSPNGAKALGGPPYKYSALGTVTTGFDAIDRMMKLATPTAGADGSQPPKLPLYIDKVTITES
jgi:peptidylprolyl isomerase